MRPEPSFDRIAMLFAKCFGHTPRWAAAAPGRVNLIGEHTDYNKGFVLPMAIERHTVMAADWNNHRHIHLISITTGEQAQINLRSRMHPVSTQWANYALGVVAGFMDRGINIRGFDAVIDSNLPLGGGLSSSAALEVATATVLEAMTGHMLEPVDKALLCQTAEHEFAGVPCGIMDQFASILAREDHLLLMDCDTREIEMVPMTDSEVSILIINTNVRHKHAEGEYARRRSECERAARALGVTSLREARPQLLEASGNKMDPVVFKRARHVITENSRVLEAALAFKGSDWDALGELMYASHDSLRDDYEVSCLELDAVVEIAKQLGPQHGIFGCRMTGGGFGGCAVALIRSARAERIARDISSAYEKRTRDQPFQFTSRPAGGARVLTSQLLRELEGRTDG